MTSTYITKSISTATYRPCAADVIRLNVPNIYRIMTFFELAKERLFLLQSPEKAHLES